MKTIAAGLAAASMIIGVACAQTATTAQTGTSATPTAPSQPAAASAPGTVGSSTQPATGTAASAGTSSRPTIASGSSNQAIATTGASASTPAKGKNSFTLSQARSRLQARGFTQVSGLKKDSDGVWRGQGQKDGSSVSVWLDYKGNVGQQ